MFGLRSLALSVLTVSAVVVTVVTVVVAMSLGEYLHVLLYLPLAQLRLPRPLFAHGARGRIQRPQYACTYVFNSLHRYLAAGNAKTRAAAKG